MTIECKHGIAATQCAICSAPKVSAVLEVGEWYSRRRVQREMGIGGEGEIYLPSREGRITSGWFNLEMNPRAPQEVWAKNTPTITGRARTLFEDGGTIPVFIKERKADDLYQFVGRYRCVEFWDRRSHPDEIMDRNRQVEREIGAVFFLQREDGEPPETLAQRMIAY